MSDSLRTLAEFGAQIGQSSRNARRIAIERGELQVYRIGGSIRLKQSDIDLWIESQRVQSAAEPTSLKLLVARAVQRARERRTA